MLANYTASYSYANKKFFDALVGLVHIPNRLVTLGAFMTKEAMCTNEDPLIKNLISAKGKRVEIFAFGITYIGTLVSVDHENGFVSVSDGIDTAMLELERIEHFNVIED